MKIYFATWLADKSLGDTLTKVGGCNRLLSYYFLNEQKITSKEFKKYIKTGRFNTKERKKEQSNEEG